jgi:hypothetical protein
MYGTRYGRIIEFPDIGLNQIPSLNVWLMLTLVFAKSLARVRIALDDSGRLKASFGNPYRQTARAGEELDITHLRMKQPSALVFEYHSTRTPIPLALPIRPV